MNTNMKFPDQHFVTFNSRGGDATKLGFLVPDGTDAAARKRKQTAINWGSKDIPYQTLKNVPQEGFKLMTKVSRGGSWNGQQDKWRVMDPRGFILEIPAGNLEQILALTTIIEGVIQGKCLWGREGAINMLVPVNSELYTQGVANTNAVKAPTIGIKNANIGDTVTFQDGIKRVYMGLLYLIHDRGGEWKTTEKPLHIFGEGGGYVGYATPKIISVERAAQPMTQTEAVDKINAQFMGPDYCTISTFGTSYYPKAVSAYRELAIRYHREDQTPDFVPAKGVKTFVEVDGTFYQNIQGHYSLKSIKDSMKASGYGTYTIPDINEPEKKSQRASYSSSWSTTLTDAQLDKGKFFTMRREFITAEGHYSKTM